MPILGTAIMDTERIIPQNGSSPGSGGSSNGGLNSNLQQSSHLMHNSSNHLPQSQTALSYSQQQNQVNSGYHHQQYVNGHTTANMLQGGMSGQSPSPIQHQGNSNPNMSSNSNLNATYSTMTGGNIMRKKKSERTIVPLPPTSNSEHQNHLPNYNASNGIVGGYGNNGLTNNAVTINNQNQFSSSSNNHTLNVHGQTMSPPSQGGHQPNSSYGGSHNYGNDMNGSNHPIQSKSGTINGNQGLSGGIMNHGYARDNGMMSQNNSQLHQQPHMNATRLNTTADTTVSMQDDSDEMQEVIEVQILPQDDNWGENTTAVTATSDLDYGSPGSFGVAGGASGLNVLDGAQTMHGMGNQGNPGGPGGGSASVVTGGIGNPGDMDNTKWGSGGGKGLETERGLRFRCRRHAGPLVAGLLSIFAFISPIIMVVLPKMNFGLVELSEKKENEFQVEVDGMLVSLAFKLFVLAVGTWAVFFRRPRATLPRVQIYRALVCTLIVVFLTSFWLFYVRHLVRIHDFALNVGHKVEYRELVQFALNLVDSLLFVHYLAVLLMELRHKQSEYYIKVVRSPDGESRGFPIGRISVQQAASTVLDRYYTTFPIYNPYLDRLIGGGVTGLRNRGKAGPGGAGGTVKVYEVDGPNGSAINDGNSTVVSVASKKGYSSHNERFYEEYEYEKKLKKRKARLVTAAEDAFTHIRRMQEHQLVNDKTPMESYEAAQAIFPTISRPLQKYLRVTRQQPRHSVESILQHLSLCLSYDMSPRAFLEKFLVSKPVLQNEREQRDVHSWALVSERLLYRDIQPGTIFQLRQGDISLLCHVEKLPHFHVSEEIIDPNSNRFVLRLNSETSV